MQGLYFELKQTWSLLSLNMPLWSHLQVTGIILFIQFKGQGKVQHVAKFRMHGLLNWGWEFLHLNIISAPDPCQAPYRRAEGHVQEIEFGFSIAVININRNVFSKCIILYYLILLHEPDDAKKSILLWKFFKKTLFSILQTDADDSDFVYELFSVIIHKGGCYGGHYHVYIKDIDELGLWEPQVSGDFSSN